MSRRRRKRERGFDEMTAAEAAPRLTALAALCVGVGIVAVVRTGPSDLLAAAFAPIFRPLGWMAVATGVVLMPIAALVWRRALRNRDAFRRTGFTPNDLRYLSPDQFEKWCADRLREQGYRVTVVGGQGDHGVDLIAEREGAKTVVQCKRWFGVRLVGEPQVRDLFGAMQHERASSAMVITTGQYSEAATTWAQGKPIRLWGIDQLMAGSPPATVKPTAITAASREQCPSCGRNLLRRVNRQTQATFWGCAGYPTCRFTRAS